MSFSEAKLDRLERFAQLLVSALERDELEWRKRKDEFKLKIDYLRERQACYEKRRAQEEPEIQNNQE